MSARGKDKRQQKLDPLTHGQAQPFVIVGSPSTLAAFTHNLRRALRASERYSPDDNEPFSIHDYLIVEGEP